jgi:hypothetical protein
MSWQYIYTGPSWAASSYPVENKSTNLAREWNIPFNNQSLAGTSILNRVAAVKNLNFTVPIIWIYGEPFGDLENITNMSKSELIQRHDWKDIWHECNQYCLSSIANIGSPVLLIGAHSDIVNCDYNNITVGHASWQKWLAQQIGLVVDDNTVQVKMDDGGDFSFDHCWGAEVIHRYMHEHPGINPDPSLTNSVWDIFFFWKELEKANLFCEVHPNLPGNQLFARFLHPTVTNFLQENR